MPKLSAEDKRFQAEMDLRTLSQANEIMKSKERMKAAEKFAREQSKTVENARKA